MTNEPIIDFTDFGFKVSVIQELMYIQGLLTPRFDVYAFVDAYTERDIDLEKEGYYPIPEVTQWFRDLPIPQRLAPYVTELYQDGGDDVYMNLIVHNEGYEEDWDIRSAADVRHFPNLKRMILCKCTQQAAEKLRALGIEVVGL